MKISEPKNLSTLFRDHGLIGRARWADAEEAVGGLAEGEGVFLDFSDEPDGVYEAASKFRQNMRNHAGPWVRWEIRTQIVEGGLLVWRREHLPEEGQEATP